jgi:hypothetical protein
LIESFIKQSDFNSIRVEVSVTNSTRNLPIDPGEAKVQFLEFFEEGVVLDLPPGAVEEGHFVTFRIDWTDAEENSDFFYAGGKVIESEKGRTAIALLEYEPNAWERFQGLYANRQEEILKFFAAVKGE